ncbi:hypothetical protein BC936DRAFT_136911 [Jimgerdemannia flammicorona]|uniref:Uncharacterized protein n=1 Tax=Jimgerdemannia flammicorona TaxID=994334 RepID=A0A433CYH6_9FUNG|nr:hypothetical protein BC936DRAFT_136911 [Jimgerdemannia flammicorona]
MPTVPMSPSTEIHSWSEVKRLASVRKTKISHRGPVGRSVSQSVSECKGECVGARHLVVDRRLGVAFRCFCSRANHSDGR